MIIYRVDKQKFTEKNLPYEIKKEFMTNKIDNRGVSKDCCKEDLAPLDLTTCNSNVRQD